jgi:DNA repair protein RadA/Sms
MVTEEHRQRLPLPFNELSRVLGGGLVPGSVVLMAGEPGIGKSTLLLQTSQHLANLGTGVIYVTGEESPHQVKLRADRLKLSGDGISILQETDVDRVLEILERVRPTLVIVDSIQMMHTSDAHSGPGSSTQVRECGLRIMRWAKEGNTSVIIAGHITKDGSIAGPMVLEHMVDVVLYIEAESLSQYRILRSVKNRFGSTDEIGIFQMGESGLEEVSDPSKAILSQRGKWAVGSAIVPILEGSRPLMVEVQALTSPSALAVPRRIANGIDYNRLLMLTAVLSRRVGAKLFNQDIIVNVTGGLRVKDPAADLAVALAVASSLHNVPLDPGLVVMGEVGLNGELRAVSQVNRRLNEASRLGLSSCLLPTSSQDKFGKLDNVELIFASTLAQAIRPVLPHRRRLAPTAQAPNVIDCGDRASTMETDSYSSEYR